MKKSAILLFLLWMCCISSHSRSVAVASFEKEVHDKEIPALDQEKAAAYQVSTPIVLYVAIAAALILAVVFLVMYLKYRAKYQEQTEENESIKKELREKTDTIAPLLAQIKEQETKHMRQEVIICNMQINFKRRVMNNVLKGPETSRFKNEHVLGKELKIDDNFKDFKKELKEIHPDFYNRLQIRARPKLTALDIKYCVCIYMKMSTKEIAEMLKIETQAVRATKFRLKQKLRLSEEDDLIFYIQHVL